MMPAEDTAVKQEHGEPAAALATELAAHAERLEHAWCAEVRARGLLTRLSPAELLREAAILLRVWTGFLTSGEEAAAKVQVHWLAERSVLVGRSVQEVLGALFAFSDVIRQHLRRQAPAGTGENADPLPFFERAAQQLVMQAAASCAAAHEELVRRRMDALVEAGVALAGEAGLDRVLQKIVDLAREILGARYAALGVLDDAGKLVRFVTAGMDEETRSRLQTLPSGKGLLGVVLREPLRLANLNDDPRSIGFPPHHPVMRSFLGVPITWHGQTYGNLYLTEKYDGEAFSEEDERLATTFAAQAAAAIESARSVENLRSLEESQRRERQHAELLQRVIAAQEEERKRVARELHDHTGQSLTSLIIGLRRLEAEQDAEPARTAVRQMRLQASRALEELHHLAFELRPSVLDDLGLVVALQRYAEDFAQRTGIQLHMALDALAGVRLDPAVEIALYRIVQEALTNVAKHAQAHTASVLLQERANSLVLIIEDDGRGFVVPDVAAGNGKHFGLMGMQERVALLGGKLTLESAPGAGTTVYVELPRR